jgi:hypothetical protein
MVGKHCRECEEIWEGSSCGFDVRGFTAGARRLVNDPVADCSSLAWFERGIIKVVLWAYWSLGIYKFDRRRLEDLESVLWESFDLEEEEPVDWKDVS